MKIGIYTPYTTTNITEHPAEFRPIGYCRDRYEITGDFDEADWVYFYLDYLMANEDFQYLRRDPVFREYKNKAILYSMHDTPTFAYQEIEPLKFICQPLMDRTHNLKHNIVSVPLQMRHFEWAFIQDRDFIEELRRIPKKYDFCFIGQTVYMGRERFQPKNIKLPSGKTYRFQETKPIWRISKTAERVQLTKDFCRNIAACKTCFAPRGVGSSSFRLFQSLISGTIPIIYGMKDRPFSDDLNWDEFSVDGDQLHRTEPNFEYVLDLDLEQMRDRAIEVWDNYFHMQKTDEYIFDKYLEKK